MKPAGRGDATRTNMAGNIGQRYPESESSADRIRRLERVPNNLEIGLGLLERGRPAVRAHAEPRRPHHRD